MRRRRPAGLSCGRTERGTVAAALPVVVALLIFGVSYGVLAAAAGLRPWEPVVHSMLVFAGSSQFAYVSLVGAGADPVAAALSAALLNARYVATGAAAATVLRGGRLRRFLSAQLVVDESYALGVAASAGTPEEPDAHTMLVTGAALWVAWLAGTAAGTVLGPVFGDPETLGLDAAFPALFVALLWPLLRAWPGSTPTEPPARLARPADGDAMGHGATDQAAALGEPPRGNDAAGPAALGAGTAGEATRREATRREATAGGATPLEATAGEATRREATPGGATPREATAGEATPGGGRAQTAGDGGGAPAGEAASTTAVAHGHNRPAVAAAVAGALAALALQPFTSPGVALAGAALAGLAAYR